MRHRASSKGKQQSTKGRGQWQEATRLNRGTLSPRGSGGGVREVKQMTVFPRVSQINTKHASLGLHLPKGQKSSTAWFKNSKNKGICTQTYLPIHSWIRSCRDTFTPICMCLQVCIFQSVCLRKSHFPTSEPHIHQAKDKKPGKDKAEAEKTFLLTVSHITMYTSVLNELLMCWVI